MTQSLLKVLQERIRTGGPLPFEAFMRLCLYHPEHGYYASRVPGQGGDYGTSPSVTPWFGRLVARELQRMWQALGRPDTFTVVEVGAGRGDLAAGALEAAGPLAEALRWRFVERFEAVRHLRTIGESIRRLHTCPAEELMTQAKELGAPYDLVREVASAGKLPVVLFCAGGIATPADAALVMQLGAEGVFVGSGIFKSEEPAVRARAIVEATTYFRDPEVLAKLSRGLGEPMRGLDLRDIPMEERLAPRGW
ncbi:MAG: hypothetical protein NVSMB32_01330 [Actinomycetota bacterium]